MAIQASASFEPYQVERRARLSAFPWAPPIMERARRTTAQGQAILREEELIHRRMGALLSRIKTRTALTRLGFARFDSYMMERLGQSGRWGERLIELHRALSEWPSLDRAASTGALPMTKVLALARVVTDETIQPWIAFASRRSFSAVSDATLAATPGDLPPGRDDSVEPFGRSEGTCEGDPTGAPETPPDGTWFQIRAPAPVAHLYDHTLDIVRRVAGEPLGDSACLAHVFAEFAASHATPGSQIEWALNWLASHESGGVEASPSRTDRAPSKAPAVRAETTDPVALDAELRHLARKRQRRHGDLAEALTTIKEECHWDLLGYDCFDRYCRVELGISGRFARQLIYAHRRFRELPLVGAAYIEGRLSWTKARLLVSVCRPTTQAAWLDRAARVTARYLEREVATCLRLFEESPEEAGVDPLPLTHVPPGSTESPLHSGAGLWRAATASSGWPTFSDLETSPSTKQLPCTIRFWLTRDMHELLLAISWDLQTNANLELEPWECLFLILRHFLETWDRTERQAFATEHEVLDRDGYQCAAPGCRMRRSLEVHHILFRSRGGSDGQENLVTLCAVHHRIALHEQGGLTCAGTALAQLRWNVGRARFHGDVSIE